MILTVGQLMAFDPCGDSREFIKQSKTLRKAWRTCKRADWMIWALSKFGRLDDKLARTFGCDCAEHVLHFYEEKYHDKRPRLAIEASRRTITDQSAEAIAARDAAGAAAWAAAGAAAGAAARDAAWAAARAAAGAAARAAAGAAENEWQANRLRELVNPFKKGGV